MILSMHQPNYLPWIGYFRKIAHSDIFVILDTVQFPRGRSVAARNLIKTPNGAIYLSVPITTPKGLMGKALYTEVSFSSDSWKEKHLQTLRMSYTRAPFYADIFPMIERVIMTHGDPVSLNIAFIEETVAYLGLRTRIRRLSDITDAPPAKSELIVELCRSEAADIYLSGSGARDYNDENLLKENGITLTYLDDQIDAYKQLWGEFIPRLSVIDLLMNMGPSSRSLVTGKEEE